MFIFFNKMKDYMLLLTSLYLMIAYSICKDKISFTVTGLQEPSSACMESSGDYYFYIYGVFSSESGYLDDLIIYMESPSNAKVECTAFTSTEFSQASFQCYINVCINPLKTTTILVPTKPPASIMYEFPNWEKVLGINDGVSNLVKENVVCLPKETNTFIPSSLKSKGCSKNKNVFEIEGEWLYSDSYKIPDSYMSLEIEVSNDNKDIANCNIKDNNIKIIQCKYNGYGEIKFIGEKYFKEVFVVFKLQENDLSIKVNKCKSEIIKSNFYILTILILIFLF